MSDILSVLYQNVLVLYQYINNYYAGLTSVWSLQTDPTPLNRERNRPATDWTEDWTRLDNKGVAPIP